MQPVIPTPAPSKAGEPSPDATAAAVANSPDAAPLTEAASLRRTDHPFERRHFVFGLFTNRRQAEDASRHLKADIVQDSHILLIAGAPLRSDHERIEPKPDAVQTGEGDGSCSPVLHKEIVMATPFAPLWEFLYKLDVETPLPDGAAEPRITNQLRQNLRSGGAVLIVSVESRAQERTAAKTLFGCQCDVVLTHEMSVRQRGS